VRRGALTVSGAVVLCLALIIGLATASQPERRPRRIALFGDSLSFEAARYLQALVRTSRRWNVQQQSLPGTAICDWFPQMEQSRRDFRPQTVAFEYVGNDILPCMRNADGSQLSNADYLARWRRDTRRAIDMFGPRVKIILIGGPEMKDHDNRVYGIFRDLAKEFRNVTVVDGGRLVTPHRTWVKTLPCLLGEPCTGPVRNGVRTNVVRAWDTVHFCPKIVTFGTPCPVYSSGAYRFAVTVFEAITGGHAPDVAVLPTTTTPTTRAPTTTTAP
jgi:hypothetical protein